MFGIPILKRPDLIIPLPRYILALPVDTSIPARIAHDCQSFLKCRNEFMPAGQKQTSLRIQQVEKVIRVCDQGETLFIGLDTLESQITNQPESGIDNTPAIFPTDG
jgi:hypothetical protein